MKLYIVFGIFGLHHGMMYMYIDHPGQPHGGSLSPGEQCCMLLFLFLFPLCMLLSTLFAVTWTIIEVLILMFMVVLDAFKN